MGEVKISLSNYVKNGTIRPVEVRKPDYAHLFYVKNGTPHNFDSCHLGSKALGLLDAIGSEFLGVACFSSGRVVSSNAARPTKETASRDSVVFALGKCHGRLTVALHFGLHV